LQQLFRFAPSPNGRLHLGHAYSALCNERAAQACGGLLQLRIEDIDSTRCRREYEDAIVADLVWLGVAFDGSVRRQSEHFADYEAAFAEFERRSLVYPCFCTRGQILLACDGKRDPDGAALHRGRCRAVSLEETKARLAAGESPAWRLDVSKAHKSVRRPLSWREFGEGTCARDVDADASVWGDVVLRGKERAATYHLAVVVDDALQGITDVVRGRDLFAATAIHALLQALLSLPSPRYHHHRLVLDAEGAKMSKSAGSRPLAAVREQGYTADDLRAALGFGGVARRALGVTFS